MSCLWKHLPICVVTRRSQIRVRSRDDTALERGGRGGGPDRAVALPILVIKKVREVWSGEARTVELNAEIGAAFVRAFGSGGAYFHTADKNAVAWSVLAGDAGFRAILTSFAQSKRGTISLGKSLPVFLKVRMFAIVILLDPCFRARTIAASIELKGRRRSTMHRPAGHSASGRWQSSNILSREISQLEIFVF